MLTYPADMDPACIPICDALNAIPGVRTVESCCGHRVRPFLVAFTVNRVEQLKPVLRGIDGCLDWHVEAQWASGSGSVYFLLLGPAMDTGENPRLQTVVENLTQEGGDCVTPDEWLARFGKAPWHLSGWWYWSVDRWYGSNGRVPVDADEADFILPAPVFDRMQAKTTYPMCKMYCTEEDALADFREAFAAAVGAGWNPEDVEVPT